MSLIQKMTIAACVTTACLLAAESKIYYGAGLGMGINDSTHNTLLTNVTANPHVPIQGSGSNGGTSFQVAGFVGVKGQLAEHFSGSIQADLGYDTLSKTMYQNSVGGSSVTTSSYKVQSGFLYGVSARLSALHGEYAPYLLVGLRAGQWKVSAQNTAAGIQASQLPLVNLSTSKTLVAPVVGVGVDAQYPHGFDGRFEYNYYFGGTISPADASNVSVADVSWDRGESTRIRQHSVVWSVYI